MGVNACILRLEREGVAVNRTEAAAIQSDIDAISRHAQEQNIPLEEAVEQAIQVRQREAALARAVMERNSLLNREAKARIKAFIDENFPDDPAKGMEAILTGALVDRRGARNSVAVRQQALSDRYLTTLLQRLENEEVLDYLKPSSLLSGKSENDVLVHRALIALDRQMPDEVALAKLPAQAKKAAQIILDVQEQARLDANEYGATIGKLEGRGMRRSHDMYAIRKAGEEKYTQYLMENLDWERMGVMEESRAQFVKNRFTEFSTGVHMRGNSAPNTQLSQSVIKGMGNIGKSMSHERVLHFKTVDAEVNYHQQYGRGGILESSVFELERYAQNTGLMQVFGPNAEMNFHAVLDDYQQAAKAQGAEAFQLVSQARKTLEKNHWPMVNGDIFVPHNAAAAKINSAWRMLNSMQMLGSSVISAFADVPIYASEVRYNTGRGLFSGMGEAIGGLLSGRTSAEKKQILSALGFMYDGMRATAVSRFDVSTYDPGWISRASQLYFKLNLLTPWTDRLRATFVLQRANELASLKGKAFTKLPEDWQRALSHFDIDEAKWNVIRQAEDSFADGKAYLTAEKVRELPDATIERYLDEANPAWRELTQKGQRSAITKARNEIASNFESYFFDRARIAALEPDAGSRAMALQGTKSGSVEGELIRHVGALKGFVFAMMRQVTGREVYGRSGKIPRGVRTNIKYIARNSASMNMASLIAANTMFGYFAMNLKDMAKGREPREFADEFWDVQNAKILAAAMTQGGAMGIYGDFLFGSLKSRYGASPLSTLLGPAAQDIGTVFDLYGNMLGLVEDPDYPGVGAKIFKDLISQLPSTFYTKLAMDYMITYRLMETASPGALRRMERRLQRENDQTYIVPPSTVTPYGGFR